MPRAFPEPTSPKTGERTFLICLALASLLMFPLSTPASQFRVVPARLFFDREAASGVVTVVNEGNDKITLQVKAMEWSQDLQGKDLYQDSGDLVFFPRILSIEKGTQKIIRVGTKKPAGDREKTYRLFVEEIPQPQKAEPDTTKLTVAVRFGVPIFVKPAREELSAEMTELAVSEGVITATVRNTGNTHFRITSISVVGTDSQKKETFSTPINGWYLLSGATRTYSATIAKDTCAATRQIVISVETDSKVSLNRNLNVAPAQCQH